ncbi:hypothetical protein AB0L80_07600 [Streptomyces sp. NPDC052069]|uniref:hypothetical protein n=1 Tax=Streptomyces sp. NPDC052069 TaxID=3154650 RepID=UPI003438AE7C
MSRPPAATGSGARRTRCPRCGIPVLRQLVGRRAALDVTADDAELSAAAAEALHHPNRLHWCLRATRDGPDMRWADCRRRPETCPHPHVIDHECTGPTDPVRPAMPRRARTTPVSDGQLTL